MSKIFLNRDRQSLGQFTPEAVSEGLKSGKFLSTDLAWRDGMESWQPLSRLTDLPLAEEEAELPPLPDVTEIKAIPVEMLIEPAWERRSEIGSFSALAETIKQVFTNPAATFSRMKRDDGYKEPLLFLLLINIPSSIFAIVCWGVLQVLAIHYKWPVLEMGGKSLGIHGQLVIMAFQCVLTPLLIAAGAFLGSLITHGCLLITGAARESFETTFRVNAYTNGAIGILQFIPILGMYIYPFYALVILCIGLKEAHGAQTWRTVLGVLMPLIMCCCLMAVVIFVPAFYTALQR